MESLRLGIVGFVRLGIVHAENVAERISSATLYVACSVVLLRKSKNLLKLGNVSVNE